MSLSTDCRVASLEAFLQARAMGTGTNAGGGVLAGAGGGDCGRDEDGKFGAGNTCGIGININDKHQDFTGLILAGQKTSETRITHSLKPYVGKTVGIVRTGKGKATLVGTMKIGEPKFYKTSKDFDADFDKHQVGKDSPHYIGPEGKYGYPLSEVKPVKPVVLKSKGIIGRVIHKSKRDMTIVYDLAGEGSLEEPRAFLPSGGDARYASLLAFAQARDCGRDPDGKFSSGNTCAGGALAEAAQGAATGAVKGAITGLLAGGPATVKPGAAIGAGVGAVKGLYDNQMRPTRVKRTIERLGMTGDQVGSLVEKLGGTPSSSADTKGSALRLTVRDKDGKKSFYVEVDKKTITVYPRRPSGELSGREIVRLKKIADESTPKSISVVVKKSSSAYVAKLVKNGFTMAAGQAADVLVANYATPLVHSVASDVYQSLRKKLS